MMAALAVTEAMTSKRNLKGHKKQGKRFIPPMKHLLGMHEQSYVNDMLPELIWLGLIHERKGYLFGRRTLEALMEVVECRNADDSEAPVNFAMQYAYSTLSKDEKDCILHLWESQGLLDDIRHALAPLTLLYDEFSIRFVGPPSTAIPSDGLIKRMRICVANHLDKNQVPGVMLHGALMMTRLIAGTLVFSKDMRLPDFNSAINDPESDEGKHASSFMRATALMEVGMLEVPKTWARHFWNRNAEPSPCEYPSYVESSDD